MNNLVFLLLLIPASILGAIGSIFLKKGSKKITFSLKKLQDNFVAFIGLFLFGLSSVFYITALKFNDLSVVYPLSSLTYILVALFSVYFLKERMNKYKWIGMSLIVLGSFLVVLK